MSHHYQSLLAGVKVLDLSHRLPGPYASYILAGLGASVTKVEDIKFGDPFNDGLFAKMESSFIDWYKNLNAKKNIIKLDFNNADDATKIKKLIDSCDIIILGPPAKIREKLKINAEMLKAEFQNSSKVFLELLATATSGQSMHDINALAEIGMLGLHTSGHSEKEWIDPPFLPVAGLGFGHHIATMSLAALLKAQKENKGQFINGYLKESACELFSPFWGEEFRKSAMTRFLHNGRYPCYSLYPTRDKKFVALAAVEEKFWVRFCQKFNLNLSIEDRFHFQDESIFKLISEVFKNKSSDEILKIRGEEDLCLSLFS